MTLVLIILFFVTVVVSTFFARSEGKYNLRFCCINFFTMAIPYTCMISLYFTNIKIPFFIVPISFLIGVVIYILTNKR